MSLIEKLSNSLAFKIASTLNMDKDREEVLAYGAFAIFQTLWSIALVIILGAIFDVLLESLTISFTTAMLRKYSGGAHATSPNRCAIIGAIAAVGLALILNRFLVSINPIGIFIFGVISFISAYYIIYKYAPVDTPNKPIIREETKTRLKKLSFKFVHALLVITSALYFLYFSNMDSIISLKIFFSICLGIAWQILTLTSIGHYVIAKADILLNKINL